MSSSIKTQLCIEFNQELLKLIDIVTLALPSNSTSLMMQHTLLKTSLKALGIHTNQFIMILFERMKDELSDIQAWHGDTPIDLKAFIDSRKDPQTVIAMLDSLGCGSQLLTKWREIEPLHRESLWNKLTGLMIVLHAYSDSDTLSELNRPVDEHKVEAQKFDASEMQRVCSQIISGNMDEDTAKLFHKSEALVSAFVEKHGREPNTLADVNKLLSGMSTSTQ